MTGPLATLAIVAPLVLALWPLVLLVINRPPGRSLWVALGVVEVIQVVFAVWALVSMVTRTTDFARLEFALYVLGLLAILPAAGWWIRAEKSRAASAVLLVALLVVPFMVVRAQQVWSGV
ncbi:MAG TPA: hypothetical protein DCQ36_11550 [Actinobacteria bacterium]|jgi:hypothetical protein|nr:hypothetical protein [Actinomycetota bacterium]